MEDIFHRHKEIHDKRKIQESLKLMPKKSTWLSLSFIQVELVITGGSLMVYSVEWKSKNSWFNFNSQLDRDFFLKLVSLKNRRVKKS